MQGCTPIIRPRGRSLEKVSGAGALAISPKGRRLNWYLSLLPKENFRWPRLLTFLKQPRRHVRGPAILIWDRSQSHKNFHVRQYLALAGWQVELLPAYAPELNPVEHFWSYFKFGRLSNFTPNTTEEIREAVRREKKYGLLDARIPQPVQIPQPARTSNAFQPASNFPRMTPLKCLVAFGTRPEAIKMLWWCGRCAPAPPSKRWFLSRPSTVKCWIRCSGCSASTRTLT